MDKCYQFIPSEDPDQKTDLLLKRSCVKMAKLTVCVSVVLVLLAALAESSKCAFSCSLLNIFTHFTDVNRRGEHKSRCL